VLNVAIRGGQSAVRPWRSKQPWCHLRPRWMSGHNAPPTVLNTPR
jgi:hypothetical protein